MQNGRHRWMLSLAKPYVLGVKGAPAILVVSSPRDFSFVLYSHFCHCHRLPGKFTGVVLEVGLHIVRRDGETNGRESILI